MEQSLYSSTDGSSVWLTAGRTSDERYHLSGYESVPKIERGGVKDGRRESKELSYVRVSLWPILASEPELRRSGAPFQYQVLSEQGDTQGGWRSRLQTQLEHCRHRSARDRAHTSLATGACIAASARSSIASFLLRRLQNISPTFSQESSVYANVRRVRTVGWPARACPSSKCWLSL